jgi:hypothetical protein
MIVHDNQVISNIHVSPYNSLLKCYNTFPLNFIECNLENKEHHTKYDNWCITCKDNFN